MPIDKNEVKALLDSIDELFDVVAANVNPNTKKLVKDVVIGPVYEELRKLIIDSRPPRMYLIGRSGHGKSSLINALSGKYVATVSDVEPGTICTEKYSITFKENYASWDVFDTRGIFETTTPNGAINIDVIEYLRKDILEKKPDIILHVIAITECRNLSNDLKVASEINKIIKSEQLGTKILIVLNKADYLGKRGEWPPEENAKKAGLITESLVYMCEKVLKSDYEKIDLNFEYKGYKIKNEDYIAIVPTCCSVDELWNIDILFDYIGDNLCDQAQLDFFQAKGVEKNLRKLSTSIIKRISVIVGGLGTIPIPVSDILIITPIQILMLIIIGALAGRKPEKETAYEYLAAAGLNIGAAIGLKEVARQLIKWIPFGGPAISGAVASSATYALGKGAELYFFTGEIKKTED